MLAKLDPETRERLIAGDIPEDEMRSLGLLGDDLDDEEGEHE
jgi:hypothetical protein